MALAACADIANRSKHAPYASSADDARLGRGFIFKVKVDLAALVCGTHVVVLTIDGQKINSFSYEVLEPLGGPAPDELSSLSDI